MSTHGQMVGCGSWATLAENAGRASQASEARCGQAVLSPTRYVIAQLKVGAVMRPGSILLVVAFSVSALAGCTMLHSSSDPTDGGIAYYLPKSLVVAKVELWKIPARSDVPGSKDKYVVGFDTVKPDAQPDAPTRGEIVPDLRERYVLAYGSNPFFHDRYCVLTEA